MANSSRPAVCPRDLSLPGSLPLETPALVVDEARLKASAATVAEIAARAGCHFLYAMKPLSLADSLRVIAPYVDGFSASSLFEASLAREILGERGRVHFCSPGLRPQEFEAICEVCDVVVFNSLPQWQRLVGTNPAECSLGLRVNPQLSLVRDQRYDPCRQNSKLGVPLNRLDGALSSKNGFMKQLEGVHFHTSCDISDFEKLLATVRHLEQRLPKLLKRIRWINLGGGYLFDNPVNLPCFFEAVSLLRSQYGLEVYIEPGAAVARSAGSLVASVIDLFEGDPVPVAVLDTTVSHMPEVFEYQFSPPVAGSVPDGPHRYLLAGSSCLAGDLFGVYAFEQPLAVGSRIIFVDMGAYSLVKASMFNGINLPAIYSLTEAGKLELKRKFTYQDFLATNGGRPDATV